jgi:membrane protein DedA with SNARE-associated domain
MSARLALAASIFALTFIAEDGATAAAVALAAGDALSWQVAFAACFAGIWLGDLGLYALARRFGPHLLERKPINAIVSRESLARAEAWFVRRGDWALVLSRFVPGSRLPTYVAAGLLRMPALRFSLITGVCAVLWVGGAFVIAQAVGLREFVQRGNTVAILAASILIVVVVVGRSKRAADLAKSLNRYRRWEFWPAWLFYAPVALMCAWLSLRYRGLMLPTIANTNQRNGGVIGESKSEILRELMRVAPEHTAAASRVDPAPVEERLAFIEQLRFRREIALPFVLKPDVAQRGAGFKKIESIDETRDYLARVTSTVVVQRYAPEPREAGIFYYRFPGELKGHIFGITEKHFPAVVGDGSRTLEQLVQADTRARLLAKTYLQRFPDAKTWVVARGQHVRLVEAGNHCQGSIFRDGAHLYSEELRAIIDRISQSLPGFFVGRYDVRYATDHDLRAGRFTIVELNGAASEATNIYDPSNSLWNAYRTLYRQWELAYAIGAANRRRGHAPASVAALWQDWIAYQRMAACYPFAD